MKKNYWIFVVLGLACSFLGAIAGISIMSAGANGFVGFPSMRDGDNSSASADVFNQPQVTPAMYSSNSTPKDFVEAAQRSINGVVNITSEVTLDQRHSPRFFDPFEFFFGIPSEPGSNMQRGNLPKKIGVGSGVIISTDGYIITNNHVISGASKILVSTNENKEYEATIIGSDPVTDIALIKIEETGLQPIPFGDSEALQVGEWVLAIGNPFNLSSTVTAGIVSAKGRNTGSGGGLKIESFIQTDAAVNSGNSGGALVNTKGELVGINTMIYSQTGNYAGYSFAVPVSIARKVVSDIRQFGAVQRAMLGIAAGSINSELKEKFDLKVSEGAVILEFAPRSAAKEGGMEVGDVITAINGKKVRNMAEVQEQVSKYSPGDKISVSYNRKGKVKSTQVELKNSQGNTELVEQVNYSSIGATFKDLTEETASRLRISYGVEVTGVDNRGKFAEAGISKGFVILAINNQAVRTVEEVESIINGVINQASDKVLFIKGVLPNGRIQYVAVDLSMDKKNN